MVGAMARMAPGARTGGEVATNALGMTGFTRGNLLNRGDDPESADGSASLSGWRRTGQPAPKW